VPTSRLKTDPLPGQGVMGVLNWALNIQIPRTAVNRRTLARHRKDTGLRTQRQEPSGEGERPSVVTLGAVHVSSKNVSRKLEALTAVGRVLVSTSDYQKVLATLIASVSQQVNAESAAFFLHDPVENELVIQRPAFGVSDVLFDEASEQLRFPLSIPTRTRNVLLAREPFIDNDVHWGVGPIRLAELVGCRKMIVCPLVVEDRAIGVYTVMNKHDAEFTDEDLDLLMALAPYMAVTIESAAMYRELREQRRQLERAIQVHDELSRGAFDAPDVAPLAERLSRLVFRRVAVLDSECRLLARSSSSSALDWSATVRERVCDQLSAQGLEAGLPSTHIRLRASSEIEVGFVGARVVAGERTEGYILVEEDPSTPMDLIDVKALEHAATVFAFQLLRQRTAYEVERRLKGDLFEALFRLSDQQEAEHIIGRLGYQTTGPWRVARILCLSDARPRGVGHDPNLGLESRVHAALTGAWQRAHPRIPIAPWKSGFLSLVAPSDADYFDDHERNLSLVETLAAAVSAVAPDLRVFFSLGTLVRQARELVQSLERAEEALSIAQELGLADRPVYADELRVHEVLLSSMRNSAGPKELVKALIQPIADYDRTHSTDLLGTLRTFVGLNHAHGATADKLFLHTNTLRQRLRRIELLVNVNLTNSDERFGLELALKLYDLQQHRRNIESPSD
jgi:hypothetical protein